MLLKTFALLCFINNYLIKVIKVFLSFSSLIINHRLVQNISDGLFIRVIRGYRPLLRAKVKYNNDKTKYFDYNYLIVN